MSRPEGGGTCPRCPPPPPWIRHCNTPTYMHTYIHAHLHTCTPTYMHTYIHAHLHTQHIPTYIHTHNTHLHTCTHTTHTSSHTYIHARTQHTLHHTPADTSQFDHIRGGYLKTFEEARRETRALRRLVHLGELIG